MRRRDGDDATDLQCIPASLVAHHLHRDEATHRVADEIDGVLLRLLTDPRDETIEPRGVARERGEPGIVDGVDGTEAVLAKRARKTEEADAVLHVAVHEDDRRAVLSATHAATDQIVERQERL